MHNKVIPANFEQWIGNNPKVRRSFDIDPDILAKFKNIIAIKSIKEKRRITEVSILNKLIKKYVEENENILHNVSE